MEKKEIYFGTEGVTSTSANYVANVAKELIRSEQADLDGLDFVTTSICQIGTDESHVTKLGNTEQDLQSVSQKLERIVRMKTLIGWIREAIKEKERLIEEVNNKYEGDILKLLGLEDVEYPKSKSYTEAEFIKTLPEAEQKKIQFLNTEAAVIGKFIHEKGSFGKARQNLFECNHKPNEVQRTVAIVTIQTNEPSVDVDKVDAVYFALQKRHREVQQELNSLLFKAKDLMHRENHRLADEFNEQLNEYRETTKANSRAVSRWKEDERVRISNLKIVIPTELRELFEEINNVGKR